MARKASGFPSVAMVTCSTHFTEESFGKLLVTRTTNLEFLVYFFYQQFLSATDEVKKLPMNPAS